MERITPDVVIAGGGVAGLSCAAAFGTAGFSVLCVDPTPPVTDVNSDGTDHRTTAFFQGSQQFLADAGIWDRLAEHAAALQVMRIVDAGGVEPEPRVIKDFDASDISDLPFGWNLPNWLLRREMVARLTELPNVDFRAGVGFKSMTTRTGEAIVMLTDGTQARCKLVIGADGRNSAVRQAAGIDVKTTRYGQKAVVFAVIHDQPHNNISTEVHRSGGPFTLVPLPDLDGKPRSAVVWMEHGPTALDIRDMPEAEFNAAATTRSAGVYGALTLCSKRQAWPIISQIADRLTAQRTALVAEAAHVVPPIGAQGLNMSMGDMTCLLELAKADPENIGSPKMLDEYQRRRHSEIALRVRGVDALNRASIAGAQGIRDLRAKAVETLYSVKPVRKALMEMGLGAR